MIMTLFSKLGIKWYEGLLLGVLLVLAVIVYLQYQNTITTETQLNIARGELAAANEKHRRMSQTQHIDESVVATITEELVQDRRRQQDIREEIIHDYLIFATTATSVDDTPSDDVSDTTAQVDQYAQDTQSPTPAVSSSNDRGIEFLVSGMQRTYCEANAHADTPDPTCQSG